MGPNLTYSLEGGIMVTKLAMDLFNDPFFIGWDRHLAKMGTATQSFPPCDIVKIDDETFYVSLAIAGFSKDDVTINVEKNTLIIEGSLNGDFWDGEYLLQGIAKRKFNKTFSLGEYIEVDSANMENGILHIKLKRNVPEESKPKTIKIK